MKIIKDWPPNIDEIRKWLSPDETMIFCYGEDVYNPKGLEIPPDILYHEQVHVKQQRLYSSPDMWWTKYCMDKKFRLDQEIEAYTHQWLFIKKHIPKATKDALFELAEGLATKYNLDITRPRVETLIRHKAKEYANS